VNVDPAGLVLLHLLPVAAGAAVSPAVLGASLEILVTFGRRGVRMLLLYLLGAAIVAGAAIAIASALPQRPASKGGTAGDIVNIVLAALLIVLAAALLLRRGPRASGTGRAGLRASRWAGLGVLGLGLLMMATNLSTLVLVLAGTHEVDSSTRDPIVRALGYALLLIGALAPALLPLIWVLAAPRAALRQLQRLDRVLARHGRVIGVVVCLLTAAYLLLRGFGVI